MFLQLTLSSAVLVSFLTAARYPEKVEMIARKTQSLRGVGGVLVLLEDWTDVGSLHGHVLGNMYYLFLQIVLHTRPDRQLRHPHFTEEVDRMEE